MRPRSIYLVSVLLASLPAALSSQAVTGALEGRVLSTGGEPLEGGAVTVSGPFLQGTRTLATDAHGRFIFLALPPGAYALQVRRMGYRPARLGDVAVRLGSTASVGEVRLEPAAVEVAAVEVSGERPLLDPLSTAAATTLDSSFFRKIPTPRDFLSLAELAPATGPDPFNGVLAGGAGVNVGGATEAENAYFVDGVNATGVQWGTGSDVNLPFNFVREVQVLTGAYEAEYGRSEGGVISAVTNSGGNTFHSQFLAFFTNDNLQATPRRGMSDLPTNAFGNWDAGGSISGPISRDRLWYYLTYNPTFKSSNVAFSGIPVQRSHETNHPVAGKLTWRAGAGTDAAFTMFTSPLNARWLSTEMASGALQVGNPEAISYDASSSGATFALEVRHQFARSLVTASASHSTNTSDLMPLGPHATLGELAQVTNNVTNTISGSSGMYQKKTTRRTSLRVALTHVAGAHTFKAGAEYQATWQSWQLRMSWLSVSSDTVRPYTWSTSESLMEGYNHVPTLYAQDSWEVSSHLRVNAGLRWEGQWLGGPTGSAPPIVNEFAPRLGVVIQPGPTGRHKVTASYGRYYHQVSSTAPGYWYGTGASSTTAYATDPRTGNTAGDTTLSSYVQGSIRAEPHMRGQSYDEITVGYERLLSPELKLGVRATARSLNWAIEDMFPADGAAFGNPGRGVMARLPRPVKEYRALELTLERTGTGPLAFLASYVLSRNRGNYPGIWDQDLPGNPSGGSSTMSYDNPDDGPQYFSGPLPNDRTHLFKFVGSYRWGARAVIGTSFLVASGTPRSEQGAGAWGLPFFVTFVSGRGNLGRTPWLWDLNLRCSYLLPVGGNVRSQMVLDVFHVGNPRGAVWYNDLRYDAPKDGTGTWPSTNPNYGRVQAYQKPMYARLGMQLDF